MPENATQCSFFAHSSLHFISFAFTPRISKTRAIFELSSSLHFLLLFLGSGMISMPTISSYNSIIHGFLQVDLSNLYSLNKHTILFYRNEWMPAFQVIKVARVPYVTITFVVFPGYTNAILVW